VFENFFFFTFYFTVSVRLGVSELPAAAAGGGKSCFLAGFPRPTWCVAAPGGFPSCGRLLAARWPCCQLPAAARSESERGNQNLIILFFLYFVLFIYFCTTTVIMNGFPLR